VVYKLLVPVDIVCIDCIDCELGALSDETLPTTDVPPVRFPVEMIIIITTAHTLAGSYVSTAAHSGGAAAAQAAGRKSAKYDLLVQTGPITAETLGPVNESSIVFFCELIIILLVTIKFLLIVNFFKIND